MRFLSRMIILLLASSYCFAAPHCLKPANGKYLLSGFYYNGNSLLFNSALDRQKTTIRHLDVLNYSSSLLGIVRNEDDFSLADITTQNLITLHKWLKKNSPKTKLIVSLGHWGPKSMREIITKRNVQRDFIKTLIAILKNKDYGINGIDIDWENVSAKKAEINALPVFLKNLRLAFDKAGLTKACLTTDLPHHLSFAKRWPKPKTWTPYVDWANVMLYDFYGGKTRYTELDGTLGLVTAPYAGEKPEYNQLSIVTILDFYQERGAPKQKLIATLPFYGHLYYIHNVGPFHQHGLRQAVIDNRAKITNTYSGVYYKYGIYGHAKKGSTIHQYTFSEPKNVKGKHAYWATHFITSSSQAGKFYAFVEYPDPIAVKEIANYIKSNHYFGISSWQMSYDLPFENKHSLYKTIYNALKNK